MDIRVIYEDENLVVLDKPAGILVHADNKNNEDTLISWVLTEFPEVAGVGDSPSGRLDRPGVVHRLDRDTSGIIVVARNQACFEHLKKVFHDRRAKKTYRAIVVGSFRETSGVIDTPISIKSGSIKRTAYKGKDPKQARTRYRVLKEFGDFSYLEIYPETGRTHQIRVHLSSIGHPVAGDKLYGGKRAAQAAERQMLHAYSLELPVAPGENAVFRADLPDDFKALLHRLEK